MKKTICSVKETATEVTSSHNQGHDELPDLFCAEPLPHDAGHPPQLFCEPQPHQDTLQNHAALSTNYAIPTACNRPYSRAFSCYRVLTICSLIISFSLGFWVSDRLDFEPLQYYVKLKLEGKDPSDCLNLPERIWVKFPQCHPESQLTDEELEQYYKQGKGGVDSTDV